MRLSFFPWGFFFFAVSGFPASTSAAATATATATDKDANPRFFSTEKVLHTYSDYRQYLDSSDGGKAGAQNERARMRLEIMRLLVDSGRVSEGMLIDIFRIENHFAREIPRRVPDYKVEEVYNREDMRELLLSEKQTTLLKDLIKSQLYLDDPENIERARRDLDLAVIKRQGEAAEKAKPIPWEDLSVKQQDAGACLATTRNGDCLVTVGEFNAYLPYANAQTDRTMAEAREQILRFYALQKLKSLEGRQEATGTDRKNIVEHVKDAQEYRRIRKWLVAMGMGLPVMDEAALREAYQKYYHEYFADRDSVLIQVLASSDSLYLDSIYLFLGKLSEKRSRPDAKTIPGGDTALPWMTFNEKDLPVELVSPTDSFHVGQYSKPIGTRSGYFIVKLSKIIAIPGRPPEKAQAMCIYLATRDKYSSLDSVLTAKARRYYQAHPKEFLTPDTASYRFWLVPRDKYRNIQEYAQDTARIRPMDKHGTDLPRAITQKMDAKTIPDSLRLHLVDTKFGQMLVKLTALKKGGIRIPFAKAKNGIVRKSIEATALPSIPVPEETPEDSAVTQEVLLTLGSGDLVYSAISDETRKIPESEVEAAVAAGKIDLPGKDAQGKDERFFEAARKKLEFDRIMKKHAEFKSQLSEIVFNTSLLSAN
jgi:hypothetical protein